MQQDESKMKELLRKQLKRENELRQAYDEYIGSEKELDEDAVPKKQITVKLYPNTHKQLKLIAISEDTTLENIATSIVENKVEDLDIVEYVDTAFKRASELEAEGNADYESSEFGWLQRDDLEKYAYDVNDKLLNKGNSRKRINVKVYLETHRKLRVVSAIQDRSLDKIVSSIIEYEIGENNDINTEELMKEILGAIDDADE